MHKYHNYLGNTNDKHNINRQKADAILTSGTADLVSFGRLFIANPDLPQRFAVDAALNEPDSSTFYDGDERGYTDYPFLNREPFSAEDYR